MGCAIIFNMPKKKKKIAHRKVGISLANEQIPKTSNAFILNLALKFKGIFSIPLALFDNKKWKNNKKGHEKRSLVKKHEILPRREFVFVLIGTILGCLFYSQWKKDVLKNEPVKNVSFSTLKINLINDVHASSTGKDGNGIRRLKFDYQDLLNNMLSSVNKFEPNLIVFNGDIIDGTRVPAQIGMKELELMRQYADQNFYAPKVWTIGNHELRSVDRQQWKDSLDIDYMDKVMEDESYKIITLDSMYSSGPDDTTESSLSGKLVSDQQFAWLENELKNSEKIKVIFMHQPPLVGPDVKLGYNPVGTVELQELFAKYEVAAVFSGHVERLLHKNILGVDYYILPGLSKNDIYNNAFTRIRMINREAVVNLFYKDIDGEFSSKRI